MTGRTHLGFMVVAIVMLFALTPGRVAHAAAGQATDELTFRARVIKLTPSQHAMIHWRYGSEGQSGDRVSGVVSREKPAVPTAAGDAFDVPEDDFDFQLEEKGKGDRIIVEGETYDIHYLAPGVWSQYRPVTELTGGSRGTRFITFMITGHKTQNALRDTELEFEIRHRGQLVKTFRVQGPEGPTFGVVFPMRELDSSGAPTADFVAQVGGLDQWAARKVELLKAQPWIDQPVPTLFGVLTDCSGYGEGSGYGIRTADRATMDLEYQVLRLMGFNGVVSVPDYMAEQIAADEGMGSHFRRVMLKHAGGYPIPMIDIADGRKPIRHPGDGCPADPANLAGLEARTAEAAQKFVAMARPYGVHAVWGRTVDEIGTVFDRAPEGKSHPGSCPHCREALRAIIKADGRTLADFGATSWDDIRSTNGYWAINYWESQRIISERIAEAERQVAQAAASASGASLGGGADDMGFSLEEPQTKKKGLDPAAALLAARQQLADLEWNGRILSVPEAERELRLSEEGWHLLEYYSRRYLNDSAAALFEPLQKAYAAQNDAKRKAMATGGPVEVAQQPWIYSYALRGNTFLMRPHSLDFFDFYRHADNAMVYETSNRDRRVWHWDSYLCDVGRSLHRFMGKEFGIYIKPHRGAGVQRVLAAAARGVKFIDWYTYGPEWHKGDTWGGSDDIRAYVAWANRLLGESEHVIYDAAWAMPAEIAVVRPRTADFFSGSASYENGKWVYSALMHAHLPVDALDEGLVESLDLAGYKAIYVSGSHVRRRTAEKLKAYVEAGGTLYTSGYGMALDESGRPLETLYPVFGLSKRGSFSAWGEVPGYGATKLGAVTAERDPDAGAAATGQGPLAGTFTPVVGREVLHPASAGDVVATYADGGVAATRHRFGKGEAWLIGTYAGVEYAWETMQDKPFSPDKRTWVTAAALEAGVQPVVDAAHPQVEGILLKNRETGKRAVIVINWSMQPLESLKVRFRGGEGTDTARAVGLEKDLPVTQHGVWSEVTLPTVNEGDILLLN